jgi:hypothetical protein
MMPENARNFNRPAFSSFQVLDSVIARLISMGRLGSHDRQHFAPNATKQGKFE